MSRLDARLEQAAETFSKNSHEMILSESKRDGIYPASSMGSDFDSPAEDELENNTSHDSHFSHLQTLVYETSGSIIPIDLSINHLKLIHRAPGRPPAPPLSPFASNATISEDFLPVVRTIELIFRWRYSAKTNSRVKDAKQITAYQVIVRRYNDCADCNDHRDLIIAWDSGKVDIPHDEDFPSSVKWSPGEINANNTPHNSSPHPGEIFLWKVILWDMASRPHSSLSWSKFAIGPNDDSEWRGNWITHPLDMHTFHVSSSTNDEKILDECELWHKRRSLPLFRALLSAETLTTVLDGDDDFVTSALLVISGLGSYRVSIDGVPLSSSGPIDPPFTDYSKRVMYRGFDVTSFITNQQPIRNKDIEQSHVIGVTVASGWWDHRPLNSGLIRFDLLPRGPVTIVAQLYITTSKGSVHTVIPTEGTAMKEFWQVSKGPIRESDLFTGEIVDLGVLSAMEGWDTFESWIEIEENVSFEENQSKVGYWVIPTLYRTNITREIRMEEMAILAKAMNQEDRKTQHREFEIVASPIGKLVPSEIPPVMPMERIHPDEVHDLGSGRWLFDFGKGMSGMLHFDSGLPSPIVPPNAEYPRGHGFQVATAIGDSFITIIYGDSLEMSTGDINRVLVAGVGLHDGGPRHFSEPKGAQDFTPCFPPDQDGTLSQRDVYIVPKSIGDDLEEKRNIFSLARQSHFTTHGFRFAEVCCTDQPPPNVTALLYRTAVDERGSFDSSNVIINGGYELVRNALNSNMLSVQSDCPHREKLPYGGDLVAESPVAMHMFDMSSFYKKSIRDWMDAQWPNGAYTETAIWLDLNDYAGFGKGAGETVWATAPPILTVRHMQHYGDLDFLKESLHHHIRWFGFLTRNFESGMKDKGFDIELKNYTGGGSGLGDWLCLPERDLFLTHTAFYMASGRCIAYTAKQLGVTGLYHRSLELANRIKARISKIYLKNGFDDFDFPKGTASATPGPEMSLFTKIVPGEKRCAVLKNWFHRKGEMWLGDEEDRFLAELDPSYSIKMFKSGELVKRNASHFAMAWSQWQGFGEGMLSIRYALQTLSDNGFHHIALQKAAGVGFGTPEYMLRHNATTMWESWWRSEDLYSRNHPFLGALAEWMVSSVAGVSLYPTTIGGRKVLFWPQFPKSPMIMEYASASYGSVVGDFSIGWRFEDHRSSQSKNYKPAVVKIRIRLAIPPNGNAVLRLPVPLSVGTMVSIRYSESYPDFAGAKMDAQIKCANRREARLGFPYSWEYNRTKKKWYKLKSGKAIGTPSFQTFESWREME